MNAQMECHLLLRCMLQQPHCKSENLNLSGQDNYQTVENILIKIIEKYVDFTDILLKDTNYKDQISRYFQQTYQMYPKYITTKDKDNNFNSKLLYGENIISTGNGNSKKKAEQDSSRKALISFNIIA